MSSHVNTLVKSVLVHAILTVDKDGTLIQIGQKASPAPTTQAQGETDITKRETDRTEDSILTVKLE